MKKIIFIGITLIVLSSCKQSNYESLVNSRIRMASNEHPDMELISKTDSLIAEYCK